MTDNIITIESFRKHKIDVGSNTEAIADSLVQQVIHCAEEVLKTRAIFTCALSGGSLPKVLSYGLERLPLELKQKIQIDCWHIFYADERCVPLVDKDSNHYTCAQVFDSITQATGKRPAFVPITPEIGAPDSIAHAYDTAIRGILRHANGTEDDTTIDLILLGMGPDGHTASLFPDHPLLDISSTGIVSITDSPKPPKDRVTMTLMQIARARNIIVVATGSSKADALKNTWIAISSSVASKKTPLSMIAANASTMTQMVFLVDNNAASQLKYE